MADSFDGDYICTCHPTCPLDCDIKKNSSQKHQEIVGEDGETGVGRWSGKHSWTGNEEFGKGKDWSHKEQGDAGEFEGSFKPRSRESVQQGSSTKQENPPGGGKESGTAEEECEQETESDDEQQSECFHTTSGNILGRIVRDPHRERAPYLCPWTTHVRFENMLPSDVTNDHQYLASIQKTQVEQMSCLKVTSNPNWRRQPSLIATIGPSCSTAEQIEALLHAGMNVSRINMSYGDRCTQKEAIDNVRAAAHNYSAKTGFQIPVGVLLDLKGPEIRTGKFHSKCLKDKSRAEIKLEAGNIIRLTADRAYKTKSTRKKMYIDYEEFVKLVRPGMKIYLGDGAVKLTVEEVGGADATCFVDEGGTFGDYQQVHIPAIPVTIPTVTEQDVEDIRWGLEMSVDYIAVSKCRNAATVRDVRKIIAQTNEETDCETCETPIMVLAKISNYEGVNNMREIIEEADGVIIQRGDLGVELPLEKIYVAQKAIIGQCNLMGKPVICSSQLLPSMEFNRRPSRSEVFDLAACVHDGADCVCLTSETAVADNPDLAVDMTNHIMREAEATTMQRPFFLDFMDRMKPAIEPKVAIGMAAALVADKIRAGAIIVSTTSGSSAATVSRFRPRSAVVAVTRRGRTARQLHLWRSVLPLHYTGPVIADWSTDIDRRFQYGITYGMEIGLIKAGDPLVLVSAYRKNSGLTNCLRVVYASYQPPVYVEHPAEYYRQHCLERDNGKLCKCKPQPDTEHEREVNNTNSSSKGCQRGNNK